MPERQPPWVIQSADGGTVFAAQVASLGVPPTPWRVILRDVAGDYYLGTYESGTAMPRVLSGPLDVEAALDGAVSAAAFLESQHDVST